MPATHRDSRRLFGLDFDAMTLGEVVSAAEEAIKGRRRLLVGVANAAKVVHMRDDRLLRDSLMECDVLLADGMSVVWASRVLQAPLPERVAGIDIFDALLRLADQHGYSVYLLGARTEVLQTLLQVVGERYPGARIVGSRNGYFADDEADDVAAEIQASGADMLFLGIASPKKEIFLGRYGDSLGVPILHGVGGSFDVFAGVTERAPEGWQRAGMEWAYRLKQEPRRLWKRYLTTNIRFLALVAREGLRPTPAYRSAPDHQKETKS